MDKYSRTVDVFKENNLRRQDMEHAGWVVIHESDKSDLVTYGFPIHEQIKKDIKTGSVNAWDKITRSIKDGIKGATQWKR